MGHSRSRYTRTSPPQGAMSASMIRVENRPHLSIRFGTKARPVARASALKHLVFGAVARSRGTPAGCHCRQPAENFIRTDSTEIFTGAPHGDGCGNLSFKISLPD